MAGKHRAASSARSLVPVAAGATAAVVTLLVGGVAVAAPVKPAAVQAPVRVDPVRFAYPPFTPAQAALYLPPLLPAPVEASYVAPAPTVKAAGVAGGIAARAVAAALGQQGVPYRWGGASPAGFDCSGLVLWAYAKVGISLPHFAADQAAQGRSVSLDQIQPGDLIFYYRPIKHVAMVVTGGRNPQIVEAPTFGVPVHVRPLYTNGLAVIKRLVG